MYPRNSEVSSENIQRTVAICSGRYTAIAVFMSSQGENMQNKLRPITSGNNTPVSQIGHRNKERTAIYNAREREREREQSAPSRLHAEVDSHTHSPESLSATSNAFSACYAVKVKDTRKQQQ
jgi:hypothetical protein